MSTEVLDVEISEISKIYQVRRLGRDDVDAIYELCRVNQIFYRYHEPFVTKESILDDMEALPPGKSREDKYYIGFFDGGSLVAIMDLILGYPEADSAWMGWFILSPACQGRGVGSSILRDVEAALRAAGFRELRLAVDRGNPQSWAFWTKNGYTRYGPERPNGFSAYLPMKKAL